MGKRDPSFKHGQGKGSAKEPWSILSGEWTPLSCHVANAKRLESKHFTNRRLVHRTEETAREGARGTAASLSTGHYPQDQGLTQVWVTE